MIVRRKIFVSVTTINMAIPRFLLLQADKRGEDINLSRHVVAFGTFDPGARTRQYGTEERDIVPSWS